MKRWIEKSFKRELLLCFLVVAVLPLIICGTVLIQMFKGKLARDYERKNLEQAAEINERLISLFDRFEQVAEILAEDEQVKKSLGNVENGRRNEVYTRLYEETAAFREMAQFDLYSRDGGCLYSTGSGTIHNQIPTYWGVLKVAEIHPSELIIRRETVYPGNRDVLLRAARAVVDEQNQCVGFFVISMSETDFEFVLNGTYGSQDGVCILDGFMETIYSSGTARQEDIGKVFRTGILKGEKPQDSYHNRLAYLSELGESGLYSIVLRPEIFTEDTIQSVYKVMAAMAAASLALCIMVAAGMSGHLSKPIRVLNQAMHQVQGGELDTHVKTERKDEFGQLSENFNIMTAELKNYMEKQVLQQKQLNEVQIAMMQAQLNPHFLYNTLDTMKWVAKANHIPEIATLAAKLAKILRTSISKAQFISLKEEMDLVDCYAEIQRIRFNGKFCFEYELPVELEDCVVPKLIVQPIVENAVIHGLADCEEGHIWVKVRRCGEEKDAYLVIQVTDDGCGISQEVVDRLNNRNREHVTGHIGFYNVDNIIRLHYGLEYGVKVRRLNQGGTEVVMTLPIRTGEAKTDAESIGGR